jgi:enoyl-CoA hydratase
MKTTVTFERSDDIGYLTFACEDPIKPATLDHDVLDTLATHLTQIRSQSCELRAVVVRSSSEKYFVVGANINALQTLDAETIVPWVKKGHTVFSQLESLPVPVIARIEGYALGGGLELAMACDILAASRNAKLGQPEANLGFVAGWGGSYRLPRRIGVGRAKELFFTGQVIDAEQAHGLGLVDFVGDGAELEEYLSSLLEGIRRCSGLAVSETKKLVNESLDLTLEQACAAEAVASSVCIASQETKARVVEFLESRKMRDG